MVAHRKFARVRVLVSLAGSLGLALLAPPLHAQAHYPPISARQFTGGSLKLKVTGAFSIDEEIAINTTASIGDGEMTWLQFGASGSDQPNATITFTDGGEVGISIGRGKSTAIGGIGGNEKPWCTGKLDVSPKRIAGTYTCTGASSHNQTTKTMGKVNIEVTFLATS